MTSTYEKTKKEVLAENYVLRQELKSLVGRIEMLEKINAIAAAQPLPPAGSLAEVAQRLVDAVNPVMNDSEVKLDCNQWNKIKMALSAAAALGIVPGSAK